MEAPVQVPMAAAVSYWAYHLASYLPQKETVYHSVISCIISRKISFAASRAIRSRLFTQIGHNKFHYPAVQWLGRAGLCGAGLDPDTAGLILSIPENVALEQIRGYRGIGPWTEKAVAIMTYSHDDLFLEEDKFVQKRIAQIFGGPVSQAAALAVSQHWIGHRTRECRFLWRLKDSGVVKLRAGVPLGPEDLI